MENRWQWPTCDDELDRTARHVLVEVEPANKNEQNKRMNKELCVDEERNSHVHDGSFE